MLVPPPTLEGWRPHLGEILDPPLVCVHILLKPILMCQFKLVILQRNTKSVH